MIEKLEPNKGLDWVGPADAWDVMAKINELVDGFNQLEKKIEKLQVI